MTVFALVCGVVVLCAYTVSVVAHRPIVFDAANVVCFVPLALDSLHAGAYGAALVSTGFGVVGIYGVASKT